MLGDSYAFGEGVDIEARFDEILAQRYRDTRVINRGVMGFGTDQQVLAGAPVADSMGRGDVILLLTYQNDMIDVLRRRFAGRAKPHYERSGDSLVMHLPRITWKERLRDASYVAALVFAARERPMEGYTREEWRRGLALYEGIVARLASRARDRGARLLVAHHGDSLLAQASGVENPYATLDGLDGLVVFSLDSALKECSDSTAFLRDGHWSPAGHRCVAARVAEALDQIPREPNGAASRASVQK